MKKLLFVVLVCAGIVLNSWSAFALTTNYKTFSDGTVLTAADLNNLQTNYTNADNAILNGDTFTGNMLWHSGADIMMYSDTGSTLYAAIYGNNGQIVGAPQKDGVYGITLSYAANTLKIQCNGATCSDSNPGYVVMDSTTAGQKVTLRINSDTHLLEDAGGTSDFLQGGSGPAFGTTAGTAWANQRPFFMYSCNADDTSANVFFLISPTPNYTSTPNLANRIGYHNTVPTSANDYNVFAMTATDVTGYTSVPCMLVGGVNAVKDASDDWTFSALATTTGIGKFHEESLFTFPVAQMGANNGQFLYAASAKAPTWATPANIVATYSISLDGSVEYVHATANAGNCVANGAPANEQLSLALPYASFYSSAAYPLVPFGHMVVNNVGEVGFGALRNNSLALLYQHAATFTSLKDNELSLNTADDLSFKINYKAF